MSAEDTLIDARPTATGAAQQVGAATDSRRVPRPAPRLTCVHRWFEQQAGRTPEAVAVASTTETLTYRDLNARANRLARHLRARGVGPDVLVAVCSARSPDMVAGLLAVLKAGGAYVPIDPSYPQERRAYLLHDSGVALLLTEESRRGDLPFPDASVCCLDRDRDRFAGESEENLAEGPSLLNLAYVIYTSGSTGRPKGVMVHHQGLANYLGWCVRAYGLGAGEGAPLHSSISFDLTVTALWAPLISGRSVELLDEELGIEQLAWCLRQPRDYSLVKITPAHLQWLGDHLGEEPLPGRVRTFVIGGEQLTAEHLASWRKRSPATRFVNEYGPTETVVGCCVYRVPEDFPGSGVVPIGRPIANMPQYVLGPTMEPVPAGIAGELYIGGPGVARGYLGRPGLTAERFVPDPFGTSPGGRLYRTGDLARWRADGNLEYIGRVDRQVKIRGHRVEPGEIEAVLREYPGVRDAAVIAREVVPGDRSLVAFLATGDSSPAADLAGLPAWLGERLPPHMVPSTLRVLESLPLTANGKVDMEALSEDVGEGLASEEASYIPARGPIEEAVAGLCAELLGVDRVGPHSNFFAIGGHSLMAAQLLGRVGRTFAVEVSLRDFVGNPTVAGIASLVEAALAGGDHSRIPPLERAERTGRIPVSFSQQRLWFLDQLDPGSPLYNVPTAVHLEGPLDDGALERALNEIVRRHEALRTSFESHDGIPYQRIHGEFHLELPREDLCGVAAAERESELWRRLSAEASEPFDLARGPLVRARLLRLGPGDHVALVTMHHIVSDGWSMGVLVREVSALYEACARGLPSPLPEPALQYADYASWQRSWLSGPVLEEQLRYWRGRLAGVTPLELPTDRPRPPRPGPTGGVRERVLTRDLLERARAFGRAAGATLYMTLLAAFQLLLHRYSGQSDIAVGTPVAGRSRLELEGMIGLFVNTLVLRVDVPAGRGFAELVARVREAALGAYGHQEVPFDRLVEDLQPRRNAGRGPLFQVMFALQNAPLPPLDSPATGLRVRPLEVPGATAKFELSLFAWEQPDGLRLAMEYSDELFDLATVDRMLAHYEALLAGALADPDTPVGSLPMLSPEERQQLLTQWNGGDDELLSDLDTFGEEEDDSPADDLSISRAAGDE